MTVNEHSIRIEKQVRYFTLGNPEKATQLFVVLHGYGQLPNYFIEKFRGLDESIFVVALEGLHRFYLLGSSGRVGASWMTKEARQNDIEDNQNYLKQVISEFSDNKNFQKSTLLGFSQGGATAARFVFNQLNSIDHLILWASIFPPDLLMENEIKSSINQSLKRTFVVGNEDEFFNDTAQRELIAFYEEKDFEIHSFKGRHDIDLKTLKTILA